MTALRFLIILICGYSWTALSGLDYSQQAYAGPEIYYVQRKREGGSHQNGWVGGLRFGYDRIKRYKLYFGGDALFSWGRLEGKSGAGNSLKSNFMDASIEGRIGYTFQQKEGNQISFTPYLGGGYFVETNNFISPSLLKLHTQTRFSYACAGFLSSMNLTDEFNIGLNFKAKYMLDGKHYISHDPEHDPVDMPIKNEMQYRVELPIVYRWCGRYDFGLVPFYEYRHYGGQASYPFDFLDTKLNLYGATLKFIYYLD